MSSNAPESVGDLNDRLAILQQEFREKVINSATGFNEADEVVQSLSSEILDFPELIPGADEVERQDHERLLDELEKKMADLLEKEKELPEPENEETSAPAVMQVVDEPSAECKKLQTDVTIKALDFQSQIEELWKQLEREGAHPLCSIAADSQDHAWQQSFVQEAPEIIKGLQKELTAKRKKDVAESLNAANLAKLVGLANGLEEDHTVFTTGLLPKKVGLKEFMNFFQSNDQLSAALAEVEQVLASAAEEDAKDVRIQELETALEGAQQEKEQKEARIQELETALEGAQNAPQPAAAATTPWHRDKKTWAMSGVAALVIFVLAGFAFWPKKNDTIEEYMKTRQSQTLSLSDSISQADKQGD